MYCQKCGNEIADDSEFCPKCGNKVQPVKTQDSMGNEDGNTALASKKKKKVTTIIIVAVIALAVIGILIKVLSGVIKNSVLSNYKISTDTEVIATCMRENKGIFVIKNTGNEVIKDFTVTVVGYDAAGNAVALDGQKLYKSVTFSTANILPGDSYGLGNTIYLNSDIKYIDAMVSNIVYKDGKTWSTEGLETWAKDTTKNFSVEEYKKKVEGYKNKAVLAEDNSYISVIQSDKYNDNVFSSKDDFDLVVKNTGSQTIKSFDAIVIEYDSNGYAIDVSPYEFGTINSIIASVDPANLDAGKQEGWTWNLFFEPDCNSYKVLINSIEFKDGTTWNNENALPWMLYYEDAR